ncbi:MAG: N-acetylmuramoyl-L-alanine amidase [Clostridium sp.]
MSYTNSKLINGISISKQLIDKNYTKGIFIVPKYIIIHDTNNRDFGANAKFNRDFLSVNSRVKASAHYIVDDKNIIQLLEDNFRGWHVGDNPNKFITNSNSLAIELCVNRDNSFEKTLNNALVLVEKLMAKYNINIEDVKRHYDVTGKNCPRIMIEDNPAIWPCFKESLKNEEKSVSVIKPLYKGKIINVLTSLNVKEAQSKESEVIGKIKSDEEFYIYGEENNWYKIICNIDEDDVFAYLAKPYVEIIDMKEPKRKSREYIARQIAIKEVEEVREYKQKTSRVEETMKRDSENEEEIISNVIAKKNIENRNNIGNRNNIENKNDLEIKPKIESSVAIRGESQIVKVRNGNRQIIDKDEVSFRIQRQGKVFKVQTNLAVRKGPGDSFYCIAYLLDNDDVKVLEQVNNWYKITYKSSRGQREGFVECEFIDLI